MIVISVEKDLSVVHDHSWALYAQDNQVIWAYPRAMSKTKTKDILHMCLGLSQFNIDILGGERNIAMILVESPDPIRDPIPILVISIEQHHFFVIANPELMAHVMSTQSLPEDLNDLLRGVLIGNAVLLYSRYYNSVLFEDRRVQVDRIFQRALLAVGTFSEEQAYVGEGVCSLSGLTLGELILFSYYLRKIFALQRQPLVPGDWLILCSQFGVPIYFSFNLNSWEKTLLSGLLATIGSFAENVIGGKPTRMIFGESLIRNFYMVFSGDIMMAFTHPDLCFVPSIQKQLRMLKDQAIWKNLKAPLKSFLVRYLVELYEAELNTFDLEDIFEKRDLGSFSDLVVIKSPKLRVGERFKETLRLLNEDEKIKESLRKHADWRVVMMFPSLSKDDSLKEYFLNYSQGKMPASMLLNANDAMSSLESHLFLAKLMDVRLSYNVFLTSTAKLFQDDNFRILDHVDAIVIFFDFESPMSFLQGINHIERVWSVTSRELPVLLVGLLPNQDEPSILTTDEASAPNEDETISGFSDELAPEQQILHYLAEFESKLPSRLRELFLFLPIDLNEEKSFGYFLSSLAVLKVKKLQLDLQ